MSKLHSYEIYTNWSARTEEPAALSTRFLRTIDALGALDPLLRKWTWCDAQDIWEGEGKGGTYPLETVTPRLAHAIERNALPGDDQLPNPANGYLLVAVADRNTARCEACLSMTAGTGNIHGPEFKFPNNAAIEISSDPDPRLISYPFMREAMLILCETWDVTLGNAWSCAVQPPLPDPLLRPYTLPSIKRTVWMKYLSPHFAPLITPPASVISERRPDGGLFLAATNETFNIANAAHMAAARDLEAALQPLTKIADPADDLDR